MKTVEYNTPIEISDEKTYNQLMKDLAGIIAGRKSEGKFYIKLMLRQYKEDVTTYLNKLKLL